MVKYVPFVWAGVRYAWQLPAGGLGPAQQRLFLIGQTGSVASWIDLTPGARYGVLSSTSRKDQSHALAVTDCL